MWVMLLQEWNDKPPGEIIKVGYHTMVDLTENGIAVQCDPPGGAIQYPERENAMLKTPREKR